MFLLFDTKTFSKLSYNCVFIQLVFLFFRMHIVIHVSLVLVFLALSLLLALLEFMGEFPVSIFKVLLIYFTLFIRRYYISDDG